MSTCTSAVRASAGPSARTGRPPKIADLPCTATGLRLRQQAARRRRVSSSTASRRHGATAEPFSSGGRPGDARPRSARALLPPARAARRNQLPGSHPDDADRRAPATCTAVGTSRRHANRARVRPRWPRSTYSTSPGHSAFIRPELGGEAPRLLVPDTSEDDDEADDDGRTVGAARSPDLYERDWSGVCGAIVVSALTCGSAGGYLLAARVPPGRAGRGLAALGAPGEGHHLRALPLISEQCQVRAEPGRRRHAFRDCCGVSRAVWRPSSRTRASAAPAKEAR
jgi:hypothetical protein